jgi:hypothetical protein
MEFTQEIKALQRLITQLKAIQAPKRPFNDFQLSEKLHNAYSAAKGITLGDLIASLEGQLNQINQKISVALENRREDLLIAAKDAGTPFKRFSDFDRIGPFKLTYKGRRVRVELGSETICQLEETEGRKIFNILMQEMENLERTPFNREEFFNTIKEAYNLARIRDEVRDLWAPIRTLYIYVALLRNLQFGDFVKRPEPKKFRDYPTAQFVYDLARFGRKEWSFGGEVLQTQTPNMATSTVGKTVTLPDLESMTVQGHQFAVLRVSKKGG